MRSDADEEGGIMTFENSLRVDFPLRPSVDDARRDVRATLERKDEGRSSRCLCLRASRACVAMSSTRECLTRARNAMRVICMASRYC